MVTRSERERLVSLEQRLADHEARCEERLREMRIAGAATLKAIESLKNRSWAVVLALLTWALAQVWAANQQRVDRLEARAAEAARYVVALDLL
jgi:hypothetical protein